MLGLKLKQRIIQPSVLAFFSIFTFFLLFTNFFFFYTMKIFSFT